MSSINMPRNKKFSKDKTIINSIRFSSTPEGRQWCSQFSHLDKQVSEMLIDSLLWVSSESFKQFINHEIERLSSNCNVAFYCEREPRKYAKKVLPFYKSKKVDRKRTFHGCAQFPVPNHAKHRVEVGSEGLIASLITPAARKSPANILFHPTAEKLKSKRVKKYVIVTDLVGSGTRINDMLDSFWKIPSIRALNSAKLISFHIISYAASKSGLARITQHRLKPEVHFEMECPSLTDAFEEDSLKDIKAFLLTFTKGSRSEDPWGSLSFGDEPLLTVFGHGAPNNIPEILFKGGRKGVKPLFKGRSTATVYKYIAEVESSLEPRGVEHFKNNQDFFAWFLKQPLKHQYFLRVMDSIESCRSVLQLLDVTGIRKTELYSILDLLITNDWLKGWHLTDRGRKLKKYLESQFTQAQAESIDRNSEYLYYCPLSLGGQL